MIRLISVFVTIPLFLAACGSIPQDRAITGGGIGAAGGAVIGAVTGLTVVQGALLGTGLGAAIGGLTSADTFNFGEPFWRQFAGRRPSGSTTASNGYSESVAAIQRDLKRLGYDPGPIDGLLGPKTRVAIARFENEQGPKLAQNPKASATNKQTRAATTRKR